jgi:predicted metal-dependent hydrolase
MITNSQPDGGYVLCYGGKRFAFSIKHRKRQKLAITVHPDLQLEVVAPEGSLAEKVLQRVERRAGWILRQWRYFEQFQPKYPGPRYVSGETHLYLGRQYRLKLHEGSPETVKLIGKFLHVWSRDREDREQVKSLVDRWYHEHAERLLAHRLKVCLEQCPSLKLPHGPKVAIRAMTRRWGSCSKAGTILLNVNLVKVPIHCIDYVIVHELCHRHLHNHSPGFYRLLGRCMPDWERRKHRLERFEL